MGKTEKAHLVVEVGGGEEGEERSEKWKAEIRKKKKFRGASFAAGKLLFLSLSLSL